MRKLNVVYTSEGDKYSDFDVEDVVIERIIDSYNITWDSIDDLEECHNYKVSTENFLIWIRIAVAEKKLDNNKVVMIYRDKEYHLDENGNYIENVDFGIFQSIPIENIRL